MWIAYFDLLPKQLRQCRSILGGQTVFRQQFMNVHVVWEINWVHG
jgi:hypothetical protein